MKKSCRTCGNLKVAKPAQLGIMECSLGRQLRCGRCYTPATKKR